MSRLVDGDKRGGSPASLKRKRELEEYTHQRASPGPFKAPKLTNGYSSAPPDSLSNGNDAGDMLQAVGSASSLASTTSSVFSSKLNASKSNGDSPVTVMTDSSPPKLSSPRTVNSTTTAPSLIQPPTQLLPRPSIFPAKGTAKGYRVVWDPELDGKLSKEERKRATVKRRDFGLETYEPDPPPDPRLAIPGYMSGACRSTRQPSKAIWRIAPYFIQPYKVDKNSVGPGEAQQVVVVGFDPFLSESALRLNFAHLGNIASVQSKTDPSTGSFLGIALVKFRDLAARDGTTVPASIAAKRAESELNGQRIGLHTVRVEADREGRKCKRYCESAIKKAQAQRERAHAAPPPPPPTVPTGPKGASGATQAPLNAPRGPSGKPPAGPAAMQPIQAPTGPRGDIPTGPRGNTEQPPWNPVQGGMEDVLILSQIKRKPYLHIPHTSVPALGSTIPHLKKRLKAFDWREVRLDRTGYYVIFDDSKRGEDETERCFNECNKAALFTYNMEMECQKYGNPNYERSPSPERAKEAKVKREEFERLKREQDEDLEIEKKNRAENLDPVLAALEQLKTELRDKIMSDIKMRIAIPIFHESLEPSRHTTKRRQLGLPDPSDNDNKASSLLFNKAGDTPPQTPRGRFGHASKPLRPHDPNSRHSRNEKEYERGVTNAFMDERRRRPAPRPTHARGLHFRLQQMFDEEDESDDERRTSMTRDTEDQESRPLSRASRTSTPFDTESMGDTPKKRRNVDAEVEEKEVFSDLHKQLVGHLLHKEPEDLAMRELELVVNTLPRSSKYGSRAKTELFMRQRARADDDLFQVGRGRVDESMFDDDRSTPATDAKGKAKKKRRTKKEIEEEKAAKAKKKAVKKAEQEIEEEDNEEHIEEKAEPEEPDLTVSFDKPQRIVDDDPDIVLDIDGWQEIIRDDEDMAFARSALIDEHAADLGDVNLWARKQKDIKALNNGGHFGAVSYAPRIEGYYVPNATGCARTEGVKKIMNEEKSKYLPHRIKVQKAREERQAAARANPGIATETPKHIVAEKIAGLATSRTNRANNRRLVNEINVSKASILNTNAEADAAIRFNQLKKRKKLVKFDRSAIHGWGLYAEEGIPQGDFIIEYVGEKVRQQVANIREIRYDKQGVGSSYLFRMIDDEIIDATKKGGIARFINHSCDPNCTAKIIKVEGTPRIVIYALKEVKKNEELTYDYKFERDLDEEDRVPCLCGTAVCKGFLN